jgi:hypothetical protein
MTSEGARSAGAIRAALCILIYKWQVMEAQLCWIGAADWISSRIRQVTGRFFDLGRAEEDWKLE